MNRDFGKETKGCFSSKAQFSAVIDVFCSSIAIPTAHRVHGVCPARLAAFFSEERGCAALQRLVMNNCVLCLPQFALGEGTTKAEPSTVKGNFLLFDKGVIPHSQVTVY